MTRRKAGLSALPLSLYLLDYSVALPQTTAYSNSSSLSITAPPSTTSNPDASQIAATEWTNLYYQEIFSCRYGITDSNLVSTCLSQSAAQSSRTTLLPYWEPWDVSEPCCGGCSFTGTGVSIFTFPKLTQTLAPGQIVTAVNEDGQVFTSPSIYLAFSHLTARNLCSEIGTPFETRTVGVPPGVLSAVTLNPVAPDGYPCGVGSMNPFDPTSNETNYDAYYYYVQVPDAVKSLQPEWSTCRDGFGVSDPPKALKPTVGLLDPKAPANPTPSGQGDPNPTIPVPGGSAPTALPVATGLMDPGSVSGPGRQPPAGQNPGSGESPQQQQQQPSSSNPGTQDPSQQQGQPQGQGQPVQGQPSQGQPGAGQSSQGQPGQVPPGQSQPQGQGQPSQGQQSQSQGQPGQAQQSQSQQQSNSLGPANTPHPAPTINILSQKFTWDPIKSVYIDGATTLAPGAAPITISGAPVSVAPSATAVVVAGSTYAAPGAGGSPSSPGLGSIIMGGVGGTPTGSAAGGGSTAGLGGTGGNGTTPSGVVQFLGSAGRTTRHGTVWMMLGSLICVAALIW